ncbi:hypothetical protein QGM61_14975 [Pseudohongiella sp. SYSU M77423]|jgi:hypothetical protein|uniref:hypothetical protein n=1 Tax=unclassified Pseudohongiella TaxID=2629611 RepID=UPI001F181AA1|nr:MULTISPECIES: hypothetical protein [unclassified Pseudohongiella]MDH7945124.1 hypothetical protein [Pseudohongiella sp. SYSU M77423]MEC8860808.1 hypothetical protein [Pseudomonadota bacterium]
MWKLLGVAVLCSGLMGCLFVVDSKQSQSQTQWHSADRERLVTGETESEWIRQTFGSPDRVSRYDDGSEVWRYRNTQSSESEIGLFLLFHIDVEREETETLALEIKDGVVVDHWVERR